MKNKTTLTFLLLFCFVDFGWCGNIIYPWRATTAIVKAGESFEIWFNADAGQTVNSVTLQGLYNKVATRKSIETGKWVYDATSLNTYNTKIRVTVPAKAPADRYDIILNTSAGQDTSLAGVKIIQKYKSSYYILHFSDIHAFQNGYDVTLQKLSTLIDIANIINPEIVFNTGDNMYRPTTDRMNQFFIGNTTLATKGLNKLSAATFTVVGNHDYDMNKEAASGDYQGKSNWWNNWWGLQAYNFTYGKARFMVINDAWVGWDPTGQIAGAASWLDSVGVGNLRLGAMHIKDTKIVPFDNAVNLSMVLVGHNHFIAKENPALLNNKSIEFVANSVRDNMEFNLFMVDGKTGKYKPVGSSTAQVVYVENPEDIKSPALYKPKLTLTYTNANDGTSSTNKAIIVNKFDFPIESAKVRFVLPFGRKYSISKGHIEQSFNGTSVHVVDATIDLEPNSTTLIEIGSPNSFKK